MRKLLTQAAMTHARKKGWFDPREGFQLFRDRTVPFRFKATSLGLGFVAMVVIQMVEFPIQEALVILTGLLALPLSIAFDGLEFIALPLLIGAGILPHLVRRAQARHAHG